MRSPIRVHPPAHVTCCFIALAVALAVAVPATRSLAAWVPDGVPLSPMPVGLENYTLRGLAADGAGGAIAAWQFQAPLPDFSGTSFALAAQRVDALGNRPAPWAAGGSMMRSWLDNSGSGTYATTAIDLFEDGSGGAVFAYLDYSFMVEYLSLFRLHHIAPNGAVVAIPIAGTSFGGYPSVAAAADGDGAGGVVLIVHAQTFGPPPGPAPPRPLFAQRVNGSGLPQWPGAPGVELNTVGQTGPGELAALSDGAGGGFFAWTDTRQAGDPDLYVQHLDASGSIAAGWPAGGVRVCDAPGNQGNPHLVPDGLGGAIVEWFDEREPIARIYMHRVLASGSLAPGIPADGRQVPIAEVGDAFVRMVADGAGGCFLVREGVTAGFDAISRLHRLDATMQPRAGWPAEGIALNTLSPGDGRVGLAADGAGGAYVSYRNGFGSAPPQGLYAQHFAGDGTFAPGWSAAGYRLSGTGQESKLVRSGAGAIVAWTDSRFVYQGVYAQRIVTDGPVAAQMALVSGAATPGGIALHWFGAEGASLAFTIERSTGDAGWSPLAAVTADGLGDVRYEDVAVEPGSRYGYRLAWFEAGERRMSGESWVDAPARLALAIGRPTPNPSSGRVTFAISLPDGRPARLEVLDLAGRRVGSRDLAGLGVGRHTISLDEVAALAPGLYVAQLSQGGETRRARVIRVR